MKKLTMDNPPDWLKGLPEAAVRLGIEVFNAAMDCGLDEEQGLRAAKEAIGERYALLDDGSYAPKGPGSKMGLSGALMRFRASKPLDDAGEKWEAVLIAPGLSSGPDRYYWPEELLSASMDKFSGTDINAYELAPDYFSHIRLPYGSPEDVKRYLTAQKVGQVNRAWYENGRGVMAEIQFLPNGKWVPESIRSGMASGSGDVLGLSVDTRIQGIRVRAGNMGDIIYVTEIRSCSSVDIVTRPAAGGRFERAVADAQRADAQRSDAQRKEEILNREALLKSIEKKRPDLLEGKDRAAMSEDDIMALMDQAMGTSNAEHGTSNVENGRAVQDAGPGVKPVTADDLKAAMEKVERRAMCGRVLDARLADCGLPALAVKRIRDRYDNRIFEASDLDAAVKSEKDYLAAMDVPGLDIGNQARTQSGPGMLDKIGMALDRMFGISPEDRAGMAKMMRLDNTLVFPDLRAAQSEDFTGLPRLNGLGELYVMLTGDSEVSGRFYRDRLPADLRACQDITSATFASVMNNTMGRRLVKGYRAINYYEDLLISERKPVPNFKEQEAVMIGYFGDLDDVNPETADYAEIAAVNDEGAKYTVSQKGNILTITRKTILNDDLTAIRKLVDRLGKAARRTHARYVWTFFISNTNCSDGTAWFTGPHGNLGASAMSYSTVATAYLALAAMTELDSGETIGWLTGSGVKPKLVYPIGLASTAENIVEEPYYYASNDLTTKTRNFVYGKIQGQAIPLLSDANDWGLLMPPTEGDMVEMGYINGNSEPEFFLADSPQAEQVFVADKIRHKLRYEFGGAVVDFRTGYKAEVA